MLTLRQAIYLTTNFPKPMQQKLGIYREKALRCLENASELLRLGEAGKAGELFWGALAEALKGVASRREVLLSHHSDLRKFARELARELQDASLWEVYRDAEHLHSDFYETPLLPEDVWPSAERVRQWVRRLLDMMTQPVGQRG